MCSSDLNSFTRILFTNFFSKNSLNTKFCLFFEVIKKSPRVSLSLSLMVLSILLCMFQGLSPKYSNDIYSVFFPRSEMLEWFSHKCIRDEVNIMEPFSHLCNDWIGIAVCVVFCTLPHHQIQIDYPICCRLIINRKEIYFVPGKMVALSDHI